MKAIKAAQRSDTSSRNFVSTTKDTTRVPVAIANQTRHQDDQDAAEPFVKRFARAALDVPRLETAAAGRLVPYSHSIVAGGLPEMS